MNNTTCVTNYDKNMVFTHEIQPLIKQIDEICRNECIPYFITLAIANNDTDTHYINDGRMALPMNVELTTDKLIKHIQVCNGFDVVLPDSIPDIEL